MELLNDTIELISRDIYARAQTTDCIDWDRVPPSVRATIREVVVATALSLLSPAARSARASLVERVGATGQQFVVVSELVEALDELRAGSAHPQAAAYLRVLADHRDEYSSDPKNPDDPIAQEVRVARHLAKIVDGDPEAAAAWLPSWRWTPEIDEWMSAIAEPTP